MLPRTRTDGYFLFGILALTGYLVWGMIAPFFSALAIAGVIATVSYPLYKKILQHTPRHNRGAAALLTTVLIGVLVVVPLVILGYLVFSQALSVYTSLNSDRGLLLDHTVTQIETLGRHIVPSFTLDVTAYVRQVTGWLVAHIGIIFTETASTIFLLFLTVAAVFYFFRDGERFVQYLMRLSPLSDAQNEHIVRHITRAIRSIVLGTLTIAVIQGLLTALGFTLFGIGQPVLWGAVAAIASLVPSVGTLFVFGPALVFLLLQGSYTTALGLALWGAVAVGMIDNVLGPYLMGRAAALHSFLVLLAILGGIVVFGPLGFIFGPVLLSLFIVLLELYSAHTTVNDISHTPL